MRFAKAAPPLLFAAALMLGFYVFTAADAGPVVDRLNDTINTVNSMPRHAASVGQPPDSHHISERIMELPEDGNRWQTVLVLDNSALSHHVAKQFNEDPRLKSLADQTTVYNYHPDHHWVKKNRGGYPVPLVLVQAPTVSGSNDYQRVYEAWGSALPADSDKLAKDIAVSIRDCRPRPNPTPTPQPQPVQPVTPLIPLTPDEAKPPEEDELGLLFYAIAAAAGIGGAYLGVKKELGG